MFLFFKIMFAPPLPHHQMISVVPLGGYAPFRNENKSIRNCCGFLVLYSTTEREVWR